MAEHLQALQTPEPLESLEPLDPLTLPLQGSRLIEASAGTGKTWTMAALYLRLVIGHGCVPLQPAEILVMSFTKAATRELSDRIRSRLVQAAACFRGELDASDGAGDDLLAGLLLAHPPGPLRQQAAWRLAMAAQAMDDAAVFTIDAWCQRMLREHAFDSGCLFDEELQADESLMRAAAVRDYWRQQVYPLKDAALAPVLALWRDVEQLESDLKHLLDQPLEAATATGSLAAVIEQLGQQRAQALADLKQGWAQRSDDMLDWLSPIWKDKQHPARKAVPGESHGRRWIDALKTWATDPAAEWLDLKTGNERLTRHELVARLAAIGADADPPPCFAAFEVLLVDQANLPDIGSTLRLHAAASVRQRLQLLKTQAGRFGFADMLERLDTALDQDLNGPAALRLRQRILAQYPAALIDEFQDTSPLQLRIFDRLYGIADNEPSRLLLLIGDPKQAIYSFRGADIYSYLSARRATQGRHHVLGTNHRSTQALVAAVNGLFGGAEVRPGAGAFRFRTTLDAGSATVPGAEAELPFQPVQARGRSQRLQVGGQDAPALSLVADEQLRNKADGRELFAALCAERIVDLLNDASAGFVDAADGRFTRLRPADIAVLVRSFSEADAVRQAMRQRGLASVYLSERDSVFRTGEALDLLRLLQAVAAPRDQRLVRAALATSLLGLSLPELQTLAHDDEAYERQAERLQQLASVWKGQGVLVMLRRALHVFGLPAALPGNADADAGANDGGNIEGERRLTHVLHLAELLQAASAQLPGEQALIRWLALQIEDLQGAGDNSDERVLRLESDADLVQVVTVHKSKGLEYPLVFLPFVALVRHFDRQQLVLAPVLGPARPPPLPEQQAQQGLQQPPRRLLLKPTPHQLDLAEQEAQREELRLLYVALTRARHALWLGLSGLQQGTGNRYAWHRSAIGYLVSGADDQAPEQRLQDLRALAARLPQITLQTVGTASSASEASGDDAELPLPPVTPLQPRQPPAPLLPAPVYSGRFDRSWAISSYSALVRDAVSEAAPESELEAVGEASGIDASLAVGATAQAADTAASSGSLPQRLWRQDEPELAQPLATQRAADQAWHRFPRGALAGNFLHDQLEWLAGEVFALSRSAGLQQALLRRCELQGWGQRQAEALDWLQKICDTPLPPLGTSLSGLTGKVLPEMEFWIPSDGLQAAEIDSLCRQHLQPGRSRPALLDRKLKGLLMGFADLVFEHQGRYWVLDYKSNTLGENDADYDQAAMDDALLAHRYDVQAVLYLLALHRLLRARLGSRYKPAQQLGGALFYFLRGVNGPRAGCCVIQAPLALLNTLDTSLMAAAARPAGEA